ncbi:MAG: RNA polymerase sigma factor [Chitinophagaceae bacterium]
MNSPDKTELFLSVINANKGIIYKVAQVYCQNAEDRKDLVQEITIQIWRSFDKYIDRYKYTTWIYRIALNTAISFYRKEKSREKITNPLTDDILHYAGTVAPGEGDENIGLLQQCINQLKELDKALLLLYLEEKSQKEIAEIMQLSETNVATKIGRIKKLLKQQLLNIKS